MKTAITNANIVLENGIIWDGVLVVEDGRIADFGKARDSLGFRCRFSVLYGDTVVTVTGKSVDLFANGIKNVHVYSMNKPDVAKKILDNLSDILG